jgi:putative transposase
MAMPVISAEKEKISYNESASYSMKEIFMGRFNRLSHSIWDCKYHVVWIPKYRRKELYGAKRQIVVDTIKQWARIKGIEIIEGHAMPDHIHLCLSIPPKYAVANAIGLY